MEGAPHVSYALELLRRHRAAQAAAVADVLGTANAAPNNEAERIRDLPTWDPETFQIDLTDELRTPGGAMRLSPLQSASLHWAREKGGLLGILAVGSGKTIIALLAPTVLNAQRPVMLIPPSMQIPLRRQIEKFEPHFRIKLHGKDGIKVVPYSQLSTAGATSLFENLRPDLIIADECHLLRYPQSARTKRLIRHARNYPDTKFVFLSGTISSRSLRDYGHLSELALRKGSPLPTDEQYLIAWANCIDARGVAQGKDWDLLAQWYDVRDLDDEEQSRSVFHEQDPERKISPRRQRAREAFRHRLKTTPGVVATAEASVGCSLTFEARPLGSTDVPDVVADALRDLRETWTRPDGEELVTALAVSSHAMQLAQGWYYRWDWPGGVVDMEWMLARAQWHKALRDFLKSNIEGLDSPLLVTRAIIDNKLDDSVMRYAWEQWAAVKHRPKPPTQTVWLSEFLIQDVLDWRKEHPKGLIWYADRATEVALRACGLTVFGAGEVPPEDGTRGGMALSCDAHGKGLNLQYNHHENLVISWQGGAAMEQIIGRTHRQGQVEDEVGVWYYQHTAEAMNALRNSKEDARYQEETTGSPMKLLFGSWL